MFYLMVESIPEKVSRKEIMSRMNHFMNKQMSTSFLPFSSGSARLDIQYKHDQTQTVHVSRTNQIKNKNKTNSRTEIKDAAFVEGRVSGDVT